MNPFTYAAGRRRGRRRARGRGRAGGAKFIAGGTNLVDLMKDDVERPTPAGRHQPPAARRGSRRPRRRAADRRAGDATPTLAYDPRVESRYPLLSSAILAGASPQLRNMATTGGNLLQRTRCYYFYDPPRPATSASPGTAARRSTAFNRIHAILGTSEHCIATHPVRHVRRAGGAGGGRPGRPGPDGERAIPFAEFHRLPGDTPQLDTNLGPDELITAVDLPPRGLRRAPRLPEGPRPHVLRLRAGLGRRRAASWTAAGSPRRASRSAAWRTSPGATRRPRRSLRGPAGRRGDASRRRPSASCAGAGASAHNAFKIELARRAIVRALTQAAAGTPQAQTDKRIQ